MPKRVVSKKKKKTSTKAKPKKKSSPKLPQSAAVEKVLVENFISLQKVMTNLAVKFDNLGAQISKLLELFEISAKTLAEKDIRLNAKPMEDKKVAEKLDVLMDQNKIIARGLTLLHETPNEMPIPSPQPNMAPPMQQGMLPMPRLPRTRAPPMPKPMTAPQKMQPPQLPPLDQGANTGEYQKSQKPAKPVIPPKPLSPPKPKKRAKKNETAF